MKKMPHITCIILLCLFSFFPDARHQNKKWHLGQYAGPGFINSPPAVIAHANMARTKGSSGTAGAAGNLFFYASSIKTRSQQHRDAPAPRLCVSQAKTPAGTYTTRLVRAATS